ncbi:hypothetical protein [Dankookia sp. P2]|uniref:hypothetical protein n=1 Tax=Dankookia sp. P2 TaxID=3423955 RepID=UPI003D67CB50
MMETGTVLVEIDAAKAKHAVAVAEPGRSGEVRYIGEIDATVNAVRRLLTRLAAELPSSALPSAMLTPALRSGSAGTHKRRCGTQSAD